MGRAKCATHLQWINAEGILSVHCRLAMLGRPPTLCAALRNRVNKILYILAQVKSATRAKLPVSRSSALSVLVERCV